MNLLKVCISFIFIISFKALLFSSDLEILLLTSDRGLLISRDSGKSWEDFNNGLPKNLIPVKIHDDNSGNLYLLTKSSGIYKYSINRKWEDINSDKFLEPSFLSKGLNYRSISAFTTCDEERGILLLATKHAIFRKEPGTPWVRLKAFSPENYYTALACKKDGSIYAGTANRGLFISRRTNPIDISSNLPKESYSKDLFFYEEIAEILPAGDKSNTIYAGLNFGKVIYISRNGRSWISLDIPLAKDILYDIYDMKLHNDSLFVSTSCGIYRMDKSNKWHSLPIDGMLNLAANFKNLSIMIIDKSDNYPPLFYRLNNYTSLKDNNLMHSVQKKRAIYANSVSLNKNLFSYVNTIKKSGFNAIVINMKDDWGDICFSSKNKTALEIGAVKRYVDAKTIINILKQEKIYAIARIVVFKDKRLYEAFDSKYAIWDIKNKQPWKGNPREYWNDPYSEFVRNYNIEIALELQDIGFDEIQFDYIRFPSEGPLGQCLYRFKKNDDIYKSELLASFLQQAKTILKIPVSVDIYGFNAWFRFGNIIGQDAERFAEIADVICPMIYPSHYGRDFFKNIPVNERPYRIVLENTRRARKIIHGNAVVRPYIQGFDYLSPTWGPAYIKDQAKAVYEGGCSGYSFWNAGGDYDMVRKAMSDAHF